MAMAFSNPIRSLAAARYAAVSRPARTRIDGPSRVSARSMSQRAVGWQSPAPRLLIVLAMAAGLMQGPWAAAQGPAGPASASSGRGPSSTQPVAPSPRSPDELLQEAIDLLLQEFEAGQKGGQPLRQTSDYFNDLAPGDLPEDAVLRALGRRVSSDPRATAYVRWQLLSGLPPVVAGPSVEGVYRAAQAAPPPLQAFGFARAQKAELDREAPRVRDEAALARLDSRIAAGVEGAVLNNQYILLYRDALYARLPTGAPKIVAGAGEVVARQRAGLDGAAMARQLEDDVIEWLETTPPTDELKLVRDALGRIAPALTPVEIVEGVVLEHGHGKLNTRTSDPRRAIADARLRIEELLRGPGVRRLTPEQRRGGELPED